MKYRLLILLFTLTTLPATAQEVVTLKAIPFSPAVSENIHVASVSDTRTTKRLGIQENLTAEKVELFLKEEAQQAVKAFYALSFSKDSTSTPIHIEIKALNVQESKRRMNDGIARVARAHVSLVFFEKQDGLLVETFSIKHNEDEVFDLANRAALYATHEKRIRAALEYCMHAFLNDYQATKNDTRNPDYQPKKENNKIEVKLGQWFSLITLKGMRSTYFEGYGISYTGFVDSKKGLIRPYEASFEVTWARRDVAAENGYSDVNAYVFRPELYFFYKKLFPGAYATLSANVPVGFEILENLEGNNSVNFVIGVGASQGLRFIPWEKNGLVFGVDFFQQLETSRIYNFDLGVEVVLGINF